MNRSARKYFTSVSRVVNLPGKRRKAFLGALRSTLELEPKEEVAQYQQAFGKPEEVCTNFFANTDGMEISRGLRMKHALIGIAIIAVVMVVGIVSVSQYTISKAIRDDLNGHFEDNVPIILAKDEMK